MIEYWPILLTVIGFLLAAYTDFKTGFIYDWITYPLIITGLIWQLFNQQWIVLGAAGIVLAIGIVVYYTGKMGGGDVKLLLGLTLLIPFWNGFFFPLIVLLTSTLIAISVLSAYYGIKYWAKKTNILKENQSRIIPTFLYLFVLLLYVVIAMNSQLFGLFQLLVVVIPLFLGVFYYAFESGIRKHFFLEHVKIDSLEEDEIIAFDELPENVRKKINWGAKRVLEETDIKQLQDVELKTIPVYRNLPRFGPFLLGGLVVSLWVPASFYAGFFLV